MRICVITVSLLSISSTYLFSTSLASSYFLEFCRAYVSGVVLNCLSFALSDFLRTSNSLSVREFDNEKSYYVLVLCRILFIFISICFITFQFIFIHFAIVSQIQCRFESKLEKEKKSSKRTRFSHSAHMAFTMCIWRSLLSRHATSFNDQGNGVCYCPNGVRHYHAEAVFYVGAVSQMFFPLYFPSNLFAQPKEATRGGAL